MELIGRVFAVLGITFVLTLLLLVLYQEGGTEAAPAALTTQVSTAADAP